jgi:hypothetical protein
MESELEPDIIDRIHADFGSSDDHSAITELAASGIQGRLARCIVFAVRGSLERLRKLIQMAERDYRDVIVAGEYDGFYAERLRDLRVCFLIDLPDDAWVSEVAMTMAKHGFRLRRVESRSATLGPFDYMSDRGEGQATFSNGADTLVVEKRNRLWALSKGGRNLHRFGLDTAITDEGRFRVQIDYLLSPAGGTLASEGHVGNQQPE